MQWNNRFSDECRDPRLSRQPESEQMDSIQGTIQRVEYQRRELRVVAQGRAWRFLVADNCRLSFNDTPAILRCFHPLDPVTVIFCREGAENIAVVIHSAEKTQPG
jgi:hypothetical protein